MIRRRLNDTPRGPLPVSLFSMITWLRSGPMCQPSRRASSWPSATWPAVPRSLSSRRSESRARIMALRGAGSVTGVCRQSRCQSERRQDLTDNCSHDVAPAGHQCPVRVHNRRDSGVVLGADLCRPDTGSAVRIPQRRAPDPCCELAPA
jgi:hypothetical protein